MRASCKKQRLLTSVLISQVEGSDVVGPATDGAHCGELAKAKASRSKAKARDNTAQRSCGDGGRLEEDEVCNVDFLRFLRIANQCR